MLQILILLGLAATVFCHDCAGVPLNNRIDCGYPGMKEGQCLARSSSIGETCCWDTNPPTGYNWCFYPDEVCQIDPCWRTPCGPADNAEECTALCCCYRDGQCFEPQNVPVWAPTTCP